ncbi:hypothetical protein NQ315_006078, partial [Exocentrus adspersus]
EQQVAFDNLRNKLIQRPVLAIYNRNAETEVYCDASKILAVQLQDCRCKNIMDILVKTPQNKEEKQIHQDYCLKENRLYRKTDGGNRWVIPKSARRRILLYYHNDAGHFAVDKTLESVKARYWFPSMRKANGQVERMNRSVLSALMASTDDERRWDEAVSGVRWGLNSTINSTTGKSSQELFFGYRPRGVNDAVE